MVSGPAVSRRVRQVVLPRVVVQVLAVVAVVELAVVVVVVTRDVNLVVKIAVFFFLRRCAAVGFGGGRFRAFR